ncbi:hypothetical protein ND748_03435 [Frankia sp. AiPs1]|uniref:hypothetical protein n=1 Tax=Frankia sp. AiPs1 TaxID=573493 RepID=UPI002043D119|nr:hypothetical protein [Frankia sp. AiPs1]MCM3920729.1 hypothetical protein [Frankia sp. AiPs1]
MVTTAWEELPALLRDEVERHVGPVAKATPVRVGGNSDVAAFLDVPEGRVFLKGVKGISRPMRWLRNEVSAGTLAAPLAPAVLFSVELDDWLAAGFEYVPGRPADLSPRSPDLELVGSTLERMSVITATGLKGLHERWTVRDWWSRLATEAPAHVADWDVDRMDRWTALAPEAVQGDRLTHTDLHGDQFVLGADGRVHVIDWGWPAAAAEWVDTAFMVIRLIEGGHTPAQAEEWAGTLRTWSGIDGEAVTAFAAFVAGLWTYRAATDNNSGMHGRAKIAREYAAWRLPVVNSTSKTGTVGPPR